MHKSLQNKTSLYFPMVVTKLDHPYLFDYLQGQHERGAAKKFVCDAVDNILKQQKRKPEEVQEYAELIQRLDEIRELLKTGVSILPTETNDTQENVKQSPKVSGLLSALGL